MTNKNGLIGIGMIILSIFITLSWPSSDTICVMPGRLTISDVTFGEFIELIPANGKVKDTIVVAEIDEVYLKRIQLGLPGESGDEDLIITRIDSVIRDGRFSIELKFQDRKQIPDEGKVLRLRIHLSKPRQATLLPVGGFYADTHGKWILVLKDSLHVIKRYITLGKRSPDHHEVLAGLISGEKVITSTYHNYSRLEFREPVSIKHLKDADE